MADPAEIARSLTEAQKRAILDANPAMGTANMIVLPIYRDGGRLTRSLVELRLAGYSSRGAALTKLGKHVRAELAKER